jgi:DNA-damage-inducible protein J
MGNLPATVCTQVFSVGVTVYTLYIHLAFFVLTMYIQRKYTKKMSGDNLKETTKKTDTLLSIRIDSKTKEEAQAILNELGMDISSAVKIFLKKVINSRSIPFILHSHSVELKNIEQGRIDRQNKMKRELHKLIKKRRG